MPEHWQGHFVTQQELEEKLEEIRSTMATQADIDALTAEINQVATDVDTAKTQLQAEIDALADANPGLDVSALQAAVAPLDGAVVALGELKPTPPAPPASAAEPTAHPADNPPPENPGSGRIV